MKYLDEEVARAELVDAEIDQIKEEEFEDNNYEE